MNAIPDDYWLEVQSEYFEAEHLAMPSEGPIVFGRDEGCEVQLKDPKVSRRHAQIEWASGGFELRDLDSSNGTFLNGQQVRRAPLTAGDRIEIGDSLFLVHGPGQPAAEPEESRVQCQHCGRWNPASSVVCLGCGAPLP